MDIYLYIVTIFLFSSFIQGLTGFGSALVAIPLLALFIDIRIAVPLCILNGLLITAYLSLQLRGHVDRKKALPLLLGYLPGILLGIVFLKNVNDVLFKLVLSCMVIGYSLYRLYVHPTIRPVHRIWALIAGFASGTITTAFSAGGPPAIIYTTLTGWSKDEIKATLSIYFFLGGILTALAHVISGLTTVAVVKYAAASIPAVLLGVSTGSLVYRKFNTEGYINLVLWGLIVTGILLIFSAAGWLG